MLEDFGDRVAELKSIISPYVKNDSTSFYSYDDFDKATSSSGESASSDTDASAKRGGKPFGGTSSIITCVENRLKNLTEQFNGTASKTTTAQNGGFRGGNRGGDNQPPQMNDGNQPPQMGDGNQPPQMSDGNQPPQMGDGNQPPQMSDGKQPPRAGVGNQAGSNRPTSIRVHLNGHLLKFTSDPYLKNDSTMVGFRSILEALGAEVSWDEETQTVTAVKDGTTIKLTIGDSIAYVNGEATELLAAPELKDDTTMIPARFVSEKLGMKVGWDDDGQLVTITAK